MKVSDLLKHRAENLVKTTEFKQWMSPVVREYWDGFLDRANSRQLFSWVKEFHQPANEDTRLPAEIVLKPEAQALYHELTDKLGEVIHTGQWLAVDQQRINQFADVTEDQQWIHTDPERAAVESPFKTTIAHGFLTLSLLPKLTDSVDANQPLFPTAKMVVNIGLNSVRFPYPVKAGNRLRAVSTLLKVTPVKKGLEIEREIKVEIEGIRRPACVVVSVIQLHF
ncbi:MaoC family dehydratase [Vibrio injensis]|uniref:MaoC family dehydratase n=1 Tax=bacterium 19MO02SH05 TaxID=2920696 RepID=A0AAU6TNP1_UNCXX|nr:MaoC family dehydratase [Vibrio injensis]EKO3590243.1 MaoC family dehydratase [Vibrio metschnikovii]EKO3718390.1 MaoC family dehydratase [Vibrio metschnikovii]EKO3736639.1 MaoC family dehydratase [Vibrio metschnikovii]EKO3746273.1 MaoC family dehydratase [Vibrio metschnikovii]